MRKVRAFTLIEMLTVIAITAVLLTIIVMPIFQSFNLTRAAETFATAQSDARALTEKISREIGSAVSVRSQNTPIATTLNGVAVNLPSNSLVIQVPGQLQAGVRPTVEVALPWTKIDILPPAQVATVVPSGNQSGFVDPITGKIDPTLKVAKGQVQAPVVASSMLIRYGLGLRDPSTLYSEPYSGILMSQGGGRDNLVALYRSQAPTYVIEGGVRVPNTALFDIDGNTGGPVIDDPRYLVFDRDNTGAIMQDAHNMRVYHWINRPELPCPFENSITVGTGAQNTAAHDQTNFAHSVMQTEVSRFDMIMPQYDLSTRLPKYDTVTLGSGSTAGVPRITPLLQFKPTVVGNDPAAGQEALRPGEETDNAVAIAPDVYKTQYGLWTNPTIRTYPALFNNSVAATNKYEFGAELGLNGALGFSIYYYDPSASGANETSTGVEVFDDYMYDHAVALLGGAGAPYPFTQAANSANGRSSWKTNAAAYADFTPYHYLAGPGKIISSFDISEVGNNALTADPNQDPNRANLPTLYVNDLPVPPTAYTGTSATWSPAQGSPETPYDPNAAFNQAWVTYPSLQTSLQRFLDLRVIPNEDGTQSPLDPLTVNTPGVYTNFQTTRPDGSMLNRCRIVPGTDTVVGPDQSPGDHYGHPIQYTRVVGSPGINQYRINYVDQVEPSTVISNVAQVTPASYQAAFPGLNASDYSGFVVDTYDPTNFISATLQARFKAGYVQLNSDPSQPLPQGYMNGGTVVPVPFKVDYRFQFTQTLTATPSTPAGTDTFAVDYDTRQLMQVLLTLRSLPQSNLPNPQTVTLKGTAALKNVAR